MLPVSHALIKPTPTREVPLCVLGSGASQAGMHGAGTSAGDGLTIATSRCATVSAKRRVGCGRCSVGTVALTIDELRSQRPDILAIARRHGASHIRVFGQLPALRQTMSATWTSSSTSRRAHVA